MDQITEEARVAVTLAALAYTSTGETGNEIRKGLKQALGHGDKSKPDPASVLPTGTDWDVVWGPMVSRQQDMSFIVQKKETQTYAFVIRGTAQYIVDALQNFELTLTAPTQADGWFPEGSNALVSEGAYYGVKKELCLPSLVTGDSNQTALQFLKNVKPERLIVTGHSQGGTDTTLAAVALHSELNKDPKAPTLVVPYGFAGLSAGNQAFAELYETLFPEKTRFFNWYDLAWRPWQVDTLLGIVNAYHCDQPDKEISICPGWLEKLIIKKMAKRVKNSNFRQPDTGFKLNGELYRDTTFNGEAGAQHNHIYYMQLLGVKVEDVFKVYREGIFHDAWNPPPTLAKKPKSSFTQFLKNLWKFLFGFNPRYNGDKPSCNQG